MDYLISSTNRLGSYRHCERAEGERSNLYLLKERLLRRPDFVVAPRNDVVFGQESA